MPRQKLRDAAFILPFFGLILIMPPFVDIFFSTRLLGGIPGILFYIFGVWTMLIALGALLSRRLITDGDKADTLPALQTADPDESAAPAPSPDPVTDATVERPDADR